MGKVAFAPTLIAANQPAPRKFLAANLIACVLALQLAFALACSYATPMNHDELCSFYTDSQPNLADVVMIQRYRPIGLEPPGYHILSHLAMNLFGKNSFSLRLPACLGFILMDACLYLLVRPLSTNRAACFAMLFPMAAGVFQMVFRGRSYGLLLGLFAASVLCWRAAISASGRRRKWLLAGLLFCIAVAINSHYYGIFILLPLCMGELARYFETRTLDLKMAGALFLGACSCLLVLPFVGTTKIYHGLSYNENNVSLPLAVATYRELLLPSLNTLHGYASPVLFSLLCVAVVVFLLSILTQAQSIQSARVPLHEGVAFATCAALPIFGYVFGLLVTHIYLPKYLIGCFVGVDVLLAVALANVLRRDFVFYATIAIILLSAVAYRTYEGIRAYRSKLQIQSVQTSPRVRQWLIDHPGAPIYMQAFGPFLQVTYYCPDASLVRRFRLIYGHAQDLHWTHSDSPAIEAVKLSQISRLKVISYDEFRALPDDQAVLLVDDSWQWIEKQLDAAGAKLEPIGPLLGGELYAAHFPDVVQGR